MKTALVQALRLQGFRPPGKFNKARHGLKERRAKSRRSSIFTYNALSLTPLDTRLQDTSTFEKPYQADGRRVARIVDYASEIRAFKYSPGVELCT